MVQASLNRDKTKITIVLDWKGKDTAPLSQSGKSVILASTNGNQPIVLDGIQVRLGANVFMLVE
tara:strand:+ start:237 stop:428 length:192 start_codon:yes stop_codon:yes gene_type:complete